jgi:hypothetical protein
MPRAVDAAQRNARAPPQGFSAGECQRREQRTRAGIDLIARLPCKKRGRWNVARIAMTASTTQSSTSVKPAMDGRFICIPYRSS